MPDFDPRLLTGAYITDGNDLYEVIGLQRGPGVMGMRTVRIVVENCRNFRGLEFLPDKIQANFDLVRAAPHATVPDLVEEISWDPLAADGVPTAAPRDRHHVPDRNGCC